MPSEPRRTARKALKFHHRSSRSASSDTRSNSEPQGSRSIRSAKGFRVLWRRRRTVTPTTLRSFVVAEQPTTTRVPHDPNDSIVFLNNPTEFDLRSYFFKRRCSSNATDRLERSAISQSSVSSRRSHTPGITSTNSYRGDVPGKRAELIDSTADALTVQQSGKPRRRLRAKEELCIVLPRCTTRGRTRSQKSWFLGPGFIGRDSGEGTIVVTKDKSMDAVHAEISVAGDAYFVRDAQSTMGTFLCLSTRYRHYPQRDGFRLRRGDVFRIGPATSIRVLELQTTTDTTSLRTIQSNVSSSSSLTATGEQAKTKTDDTRFQPPKLERIASTSSNNSDSAQNELKRMSTVDEFRLLAADIEDELMNDAGRTHSRVTPRNTVDNDNAIGSDIVETKTSARSKAQCSVRFTDALPMMSDGSVFLGSRYLYPEVKELHYHEPSQVEDAEDDTIKQLVGSENESSTTLSSPSSVNIRRAAFIRLAIFQHDPTKASSEPVNPRDAREVSLPGQGAYLIGSSAACDVRIFPSEGLEIRAVHSRISFDGTNFVLQDVSFERDPRRQTRVLLTQRPVRITRGDWLLLGKCALYISTVARAFGSERRPDMKEAAMRLDILRLSKRKPRTRGLFVPVGFRLHSASGSGASSGSSGWGGSSGGPVTFGKGRDCDAQVFTASLATEQFSVQLERGTCMLTPKPTGINSGTYFLIGRDEPGSLSLEDASCNSGSDSDESKHEIVKITSKPLLLSEGCVFRCGGCEVEVIYSKSASAIPTAQEQEHARFLSAMPWLQSIASDLKVIANVARCGQRLKLGPGDSIYEKGDAANFVFIVISGEVVLHLGLENGERDHDSDILIEQVSAGGYFGEVSLNDPLDPCATAPNCDDHEYPESARAATACELLALAKEDVCGYLGLYMDIVRTHLRHDRYRDRVIRVACSCVPWLRGISLQEMRLLSSQAEVAVYPPGSVLFEDGKLFVPAAFAGGNTLQLRDGLLVLSRGNARVVRSKRERQHRRNLKTYHVAEDVDENHFESLRDDDDEASHDPDEWWSPVEPVLAMSSSSSPSVLSVCDMSFRLEACSTVECYFLAAVHLVHLSTDSGTKQQPATSLGPEMSSVTHVPPPLKRGSSSPRRMHHSQVVTSALHSGEHSSEDDDDHSSLDGSDGEGDNTAARRWRRKKRNKHLLDQTVAETQNDAEMPNALVLYVLSGPQRGDIHVVRNVASVGGFLSGADIELNDRYISRAHAVIEYHEGRYWLYDNGSKWGTFVRLEEENAVDINPGDVFLAGEVEFTCLASYPERNKPSMCCVM